MKAHPENFQFIILGNKPALPVVDITTKSVSSVTLLGITIDSKLNFKKDINNIIKEAYYKLYTQRRLRMFLT